MSRKFEPVQDIISPYAKSKLNKDFKYLFENLTIQGKTIQDLVAKGQLTPSEYAELLQAVNGLLSKGHGQVGIDDLNEEVYKILKEANPEFNILSIPRNESVSLEKLDAYNRKRISEVNEIIGDDVDVIVGGKDFNQNPRKLSGITEWTYIMNAPATETGNLTIKGFFHTNRETTFLILDKKGDTSFEVVDRIIVPHNSSGVTEYDTGKIIKTGQYIGAINNANSGSLYDDPSLDEGIFRARFPAVEESFNAPLVLDTTILFTMIIGGREGELEQLRREIKSNTGSVSGLIQVKEFGNDGDAIIEALSFSRYGDTVILEPQTYVTTKTIKVPFGVTLMGRGLKSKIKLANAPQRQLTGYWWRQSNYTAYPIVTTEFIDNSSNRTEIQGQSPKFKNFFVQGNTDVKSPQGEKIIGLLVSNVENGDVENVRVEDVDYFSNGAVDGYGIVTRHCNNIRLINPSGKNCGYENLGIYDGSKNIDIYNPQFGNAGRVSGQIHRDTENINIYGGSFINKEKINSDDENTGSFTIHGNTLAPIKKVNFIKTIFKSLGEGSNIGVRAFGTQEDVHFDNVDIESDNIGCIEAYGKGTRFSGKLKHRGAAGYAGSFGGEDINLHDFDISSESHGLNISDADINRLDNFRILAKGFGIRNDKSFDTFGSNGYVKSINNTALHQSSSDLSGFYKFHNVIFISEGSNAIMLSPNLENREKTIFNNCHIENHNGTAIDMSHDGAKLENSTVIGTLRLRGNKDCLIWHNDLRKATLEFIGTTKEEHYFINNIDF